jgi:ADP-dependent NAD(P)H-hydrate dehydratase / NAD(P)H-hydrate epimerase
VLTVTDAGRTTRSQQVLPHALYRREQVQRFDQTAIRQFGIAGELLMERAGRFSFSALQRQWPGARQVTVVCGTGNNGGDGYVIARLAQQAGLDAVVLQLGDHHRLRGDARLNAERCAALRIPCEPFRKIPDRTHVIVDAALGTGLQRDVSGTWAAALRAINLHRAPVMAVDIPSGLNADTGAVMGDAVRADLTATFIALKQGMFTGQGADCCGAILFDALDIPARLFATEMLSARRVDWQRQQQLLPARRRTAHKGDCGHLLIVGGARGFSGAARLAGEGALRSGAGLVTVATAEQHAGMIAASRPELMCHGVATPHELESLLTRCDVIAVGPGLGTGEWGKALLECVLASGKPLLVDADALNLLAQQPRYNDNWILTPHPGEAARLLGVTTEQIQADRFVAAQRLQQRYGGVIVLKGSGTLIQSPGQRTAAVCSDGNAGMATAGTGDVLSGVISALLAQGVDPSEAAETGVCLHAAAADLAVKQGQRGMIASDLFEPIRRLLP